MSCQNGDLNPVYDLAIMVNEIIRKGKCFWSNQQTIISVLSCLEEECRELFDALHAGDKKEIISEIGDVLGLAVMLCCIAERQGVCSIGEPALDAMNKIRRRSPYVFDDSLVVNSPEEAEALWQSLKAQEKNEENQPLNRLPLSRLSTFALADHIVENMLDNPAPEVPKFDSEEDLGNLLYRIFRQSKEKKLNPEKAFRKFLFARLTEIRDSSHKRE